MTHTVIILAQGSQRRLPDLGIPKQLLTLDHEGKSIPIIVRTIRQLSWMGIAAHDISVVCEGALAQYLRNDEVMSIGVRVGTLVNPGNSSLKGIDQLLISEGGELRPNFCTRPDGVVVLLGDVVYSHFALKVLIDPLRWVGIREAARFVVSDDLSQSTGEVWGLRWNVANSAPMGVALRTALANHPPFDHTYQPGQMRQWLFRLADASGPGYWGTWTIGRKEDYTMDVDTPKDIPLLASISARVWQDDAGVDFQW